MPRKLSYYVFVFIGMGISLLISSYLLNTLFIQKNPTPFWDSLSGNVAEFKRSSLLAQNQALNFIQQAIQSNKVSSPAPTPARENTISFFDAAPAPTSPPEQSIAPSSTPFPTSPPLPTPRVVLPTKKIYFPSPSKPSIKPTSKPISTPIPKPTKIIPTKAPKPTTTVDFPKVVGDPLKQTWYGNGSLACYTTERNIAVYANGLTPNACYANVKAYIDSNIVSTNLLGRSIQVHKKALPAFEAVAKTLDQYKVDNSTYKFPSKTYKIKNVGAYVFRCNVNASTSGKADVCATGCKLSPHAFGIAVDINYDENCNGCKNYDMPKEISDTFEIYGFRWGGHYPLLGSYIDAMHFEYMRDLCEGI